MGTVIRFRLYAAMSDEQPKEEQLQKAVVNRVLKAALPDGVQVAASSKDIIQKAAGLFILHLTHSANQYCKESNRSTIQQQDVEKAIKDIQFEEFWPKMESCLQAQKKDKEDKKTKKGK